MITGEERKIVSTIRSCNSFEQLENAKRMADNYISEIVDELSRIATKEPFVPIEIIFNWEIHEKGSKLMELVGENTESL